MQFYGATDGNKLIHQTRFTELVKSIRTAQEPPTLRELKKIFPAADFEKFLEATIQQGLVKRVDRRYFLQLSYYDLAAQRTAMTDPKLREYLMEFLSWSEKMQLSCVAQLASRLSQGSLFATADELLLPRAYQTGNLDLQLLTLLFVPRADTDSLACFFARNEQGQTLKQDPLTTLIGDVDPTYFFDQVQVIIEGIKSGQKLRPSIFLTALADTGVVVDGQLRLAVIPESTQLFFSDLKGFPLHIFLQMVGDRLKKTAWSFFIATESK